MRKFRALAAVAVACIAAPNATAQAGQSWTTADGFATIIVDQHALDLLGLQIFKGADEHPLSALVFDLDSKSDLVLATDGYQLKEYSRGLLSVSDTLRVVGNGRSVSVEGLAIRVTPGSDAGNFEALVTDPAGHETLFVAMNAKSMFVGHTANPFVDIRGANLMIGAELAGKLGKESLAGKSIGYLEAHADVLFAGGDVLPPLETMTDPSGNPRAPSGPDVIVGGVAVSGGGGNTQDVVQFGPVGGIKAYSAATTSCNVGDTVLNWLDCTDGNNPNCAKHPVISQNMYRLANGRFEQLGQSWLKHGFCALSQTLCGTCSATDCDTLGIGCSDPYTGSRNSGPGLGPKSEVNAFTGVFPYPFGLNSTGNAQISGRLQVASTDVTPSSNPGALYWIECQYTTQDDAAAGNASNNASSRQVQFNASLAPTMVGTTNQMIQGIKQWKLHDPAVVETNISVPNEGLMILAAKATDLGGGQWHYEYALFNQNSDRSAGSFSVPIGGATVTNIGFHDVAYHSGEPYSGTDWTSSISNHVLTWSTQTFAQNVNANALRWGTMYNFRFDANVPPSETMGDVDIGLFKPGTPSSVAASTVVPTPAALIISLPDSSPTVLLTPCETRTFNVNIAAGSQTLTPGTAVIHYSYDDAPYQSSALTPLGGELYQASLTVPRCGATAKFYISAQGNGGGTTTLPTDAPTDVFTPDVAVVKTTVVLPSVGFESGLPGDWTASGLWTTDASCAILPLNCASGSFAYYGQPGSCDYATGTTTNSGSLSFQIALPAATNAELRYCSAFTREAFATSDWPSVKVNGAVVDQPALGGLGSSPWVERVVNLSAYVGQTVTVEFFFNTVDGFNNAFKGWQIDNVRLNTTQLGCSVGDFNDDGYADGEDLQSFVEAVMAQSTVPSDVCHGDFSDNNVVDDADISGMVNTLLGQP